MLHISVHCQRNKLYSATPDKSPVPTPWGSLCRVAVKPFKQTRMDLLGTDEPLVDLYMEVDAERDHIRGPIEAPVTVVEYGDFECPYCEQAEPFVRELLREFGDVSYVWRHYGAYDTATLAAAVRAAKARATVATT
jgi:protein-disulfide isomerase